MIKNLVFTSAGDNTRFTDWWVSNDQNYDIFVYYYGNNEANFNRYKEKVTYIEKSKGVKFQNFYKLYKNSDIINKYERFFILDDDIEISSKDINEMFKLSEEYSLEICGPSFTHDSKISWRHMTHRENTLLTYTNFIEVNVPLFTRNALKKLMDIYDPKLLEWGVDFLYIFANGVHNTSSYAIIHKVQCKNPKDINKVNGKNEMLTNSTIREREDRWKEVARKMKYPFKYIVKNYKRIPLPRKPTKTEHTTNILTVVLSCEKNKSLWVDILNRNIPNIVILCGGSESTYLKNNILYLKCNDLYDGLPEKMICAIDFILKEPRFNSITHILKVDDHDTLFTQDSIINLEGYYNSFLHEHHYLGQIVYKVGNFSHHLGKVPHNPFWNLRGFQGPVEPFASGNASYILSKYAMKCINSSFNLSNLTFLRYMFILEDVMMGIILKSYNIEPYELKYEIEYDIQMTVDKKWLHIGQEYETIEVPAGSLVRFGKCNTWTEKRVYLESFYADTSFFNDPLPGALKEVHFKIN